MQQLFKRPLLVAGVALFLLGTGNWIVGRIKLTEYRGRAESSGPVASIAPIDGLPHLTPEKNAALLERLHPRPTAYSFAQAKLDFYRVVDAGGRALALLGVLFITTSLLHWRRDRQSPARQHRHEAASA